MREPGDTVSRRGQQPGTHTEGQGITTELGDHHKVSSPLSQCLMTFQRYSEKLSESDPRCPSIPQEMEPGVGCRLLLTRTQLVTFSYKFTHFPVPAATPDKDIKVTHNQQAHI